MEGKEFGEETRKGQVARAEGGSLGFILNAKSGEYFKSHSGCLCEGRNEKKEQGCESSGKTPAGGRVEVTCPELGGSWGHSSCALVSSRGCHSQGLPVSRRGGEPWIASRCIWEAGHTGFDGGLNVRAKEERGPRMTCGPLA